MLGWAPILRLNESLDWIVEWYRELERGGDMRLATERQIRRYIERANVATDPTLNAAVVLQTV